MRADWLGSSHRIFVDTTWTPKRFETRVTVKISVNGDSLRTLQAKHWVIGRKLFQLTVPETVAAGSKARIEVRVQLGGRAARTTHVTLDLPLTPSTAAAHGGDGEARAFERRAHALVRVRPVELHADLAHQVGVGRAQPLDARQRRSDLLDAARAVDTLDLEDLGDHAASVPGASGVRPVRSTAFASEVI